MGNQGSWLEWWPLNLNLFNKPTDCGEMWAYLFLFEPKMVEVIHVWLAINFNSQPWPLLMSSISHLQSHLHHLFWVVNEIFFWNGELHPNQPRRKRNAWDIDFFLTKIPGFDSELRDDPGGFQRTGLPVGGPVCVLQAYWVFPKIGGTPPKWMVKRMENPIEMDDLGGYHHFRKHPVQFCKTFFFSSSPWTKIPLIFPLGGGLGQRHWSAGVVPENVTLAITGSTDFTHLQFWQMDHFLQQRRLVKLQFFSTVRHQAGPN